MFGMGLMPVRGSHTLPARRGNLDSIEDSDVITEGQDNLLVGRPRMIQKVNTPSTPILRKPSG